MPIYFHDSLASGVQHELLPFKLKSYLPFLTAATENQEQIISPREVCPSTALLILTLLGRICPAGIPRKWIRK